MEVPGLNDYRVTFKKSTQRDGKHFILVDIILNGQLYGITSQTMHNGSTRHYLANNGGGGYHFTQPVGIVKDIVKECILDDIRERKRRSDQEIVRTEEIKVTF